MNDIAVIIPVYNGEDLLDSCLDSVMKAGERVSEIIIVDDGSTDETLSVASIWAETDERIRVIHTENHGSYMARVTGIKKATARYIAFVDVDDSFFPGALNRLADLLEEHEADIAWGGIVVSNKQGVENIRENQNTYRIQTATVKQIWPRIMKWKTQEFLCYLWHKLYKRELFDRLPEVEGICQGDDVILTCRAFLNAKRIVETTELAYHYYINPVGLTHSGFSDSDLDLIRVWDEIIRMMDRTEKLPEVNPDLSYLVKYNRWRTDFTLICRLILADDRQADHRYASDLRIWQNELSLHWWDLIQPHAMPRNRELLILGLRFFYTPTKVIMRIIKRILRGDKRVLLHNGDLSKDSSR